ncbi:hypothetical protein ADIWIN_1101 [Winogradskyella psychrotolerans RS-3]|uniref:Uncharacterized protein n=1 Tax=Winogradskyella psychrotolerans RS-3 TaxID=641526 RepID=S7VV25_9FLAO|nr:hypothetical protein ADIWIN_1101 [Winogradskyella psychrotolerans RS-3]
MAFELMRLVLKNLLYNSLTGMTSCTTEKSMAEAFDMSIALIKL